MSTARALLPYQLADLLTSIQCYEDAGDYASRNRYVMEAMRAAEQIGYLAGIAFDAHEPGWPICYIELPTGQVSWHIPGHPIAWDGHTTLQKVERMRRYVEIAAPSLVRAFAPVATDNSPPR